MGILFASCLVCLYRAVHLDLYVYNLPGEEAAWQNTETDSLADSEETERVSDMEFVTDRIYDVLKIWRK